MKISDYMILATSGRHDAAARFWRNQVADLGAIASITRAGAGPSPRQSIEITLSSSAVRAMNKLADDPVGRFTVAAAAIALAVARYTARSRVLIRTPLLADAAAPLNEAGEVPLVFAVDPQQTLGQFLQSAAAIVEETYSQQDFPVSMLCEHEAAIDVTALAEFSLSSAVHDGRLARLSPIHFDLDRLAQDLVAIDFDPRAAEPFIVAGLADAIATAFDRLADLKTIVGGIERVSPAQRRLLLEDWNDTATIGEFTSVVDWFQQRVNATPDAVAIRFEGAALTYRELNRRANAVAHHVLARVQPGETPIALWMDRSPWLVAALLGILKAGRGYAPIDPEWPSERVAFVLRDCQAAAVLIDAAKTGLLDGADCEAIVVDRELVGADQDPDLRIAPGDLAYVIYTSGSTGQPKGCAIEHRHLLNYVRWAIDYYWSDPAAGTMALFTPLSFDLTVPSVFCPLLRGRTLVIYPQQMAADEMVRRQFAAGSGVDSVKMTPAHIRLLATDPPTATDVRVAIVGGEALTTEHVEALHRIDARIRVINEYGPTETTVGCIVKDVAQGERVTIGRPIANTRAYVLDGEQQLLPVGIRGEIWIGGAGVGRGYLGRPELNADRFRADPFVSGGRMYRTGDIGRWLPDGELECFGRVDTQLKVRGYRIEPGEIEAALVGCPGIEDAAVIERNGQLVAYVVGAAAADQHALRGSLAQTLPSYMVPGVFVVLDTLPLTANGKVDRARLQASDAAQGRRSYVAPATAYQHALARVWEDVLHVERVGVDENFFELGGHSLRAMAMLPMIHRALGIEASIGDILSNPTIAQLAVRLEQQAPRAVESIPALAAADHYAVSSGQRRLWLIDRIEERTAAYNISSAFEVEGSLDLEALAAALDTIVARHESLRTVFIEVDDEPRQRVLASLRIAIHHVDLTNETDPDRPLQTAIEHHASAAFHLARGPLLRVIAVRLGNARFVVGLTIHHIISDEWSMRVLIGELVRAYAAHSSAAPAQLPELRIQYRDYAAWQNRLLDGDRGRAEEAYWLATLAGPVAALDLPSDFARPAAVSYRGRHHQIRIDAATTSRLRSMAAASGASPFMALLAAVKTLLYRYTGEPDICVGTPIAGRTHADLAQQIGFFVNTLVLRDRVDGTIAFRDMLVRVKQTATAAYEHQSYPFDRLVDRLDVRRDLSRSPLFDVMVAYEADQDLAPNIGGLTVRELRLESGVSKFDLTLTFAESNRGIDLDLEYSIDLFRAASIERLASDLLRIIDAVAADATVTIDRIAIDGPLASRQHAAPPQAPRESRPPMIGPRDERELVLIGLLETLLGRGGFGVADNFFFIGGDSINAVQLVNRLARAGWALRVRDVFEAPTLAALATRLTRSRGAKRAEPVTGDVPLTPIQQWFFKTQPEQRQHFNQSVMLAFDTRIDEASLRRLGAALVDQHDALRLRYRFDRGEVRQFYGDAYDPVEVHDLRGIGNPFAELERLATAVQGSLDLERGPLARLVLFQLPDGDRLLAVVHHLAIDGVSWRVLFDDLRSGLEQVSRQQTITLGDKTTSYQAWAAALQARIPEISAQRSWWDEVLRTPSVALPIDQSAIEPLEADTIEARFTLSAHDTQLLASRVHRVYNTRTNDVLIAALAMAIREWAGQGALRIDLEGHGRDTLDLDTSRTVGWFTTLYPVIVDIGDSIEAGTVLNAAKAALRRVPDNGAGYGLLNEGRPSGASILFNFLGQFDTDHDAFRIADEPRGPEHGARTRRTHDVTVGGWISDGQLSITIRHAREQQAVTQLGAAYQRALEGLTAHCADHAAVEPDAADLRDAAPSTISLIDRLGRDRVADVYPLSPMQQGMLYHCALEDRSALYVEQFTCTITGALDVDSFRDAWERTAARHPALRTAFFWDEVERPLQVVFARVDLPWTTVDWRGVPREEQPARLERFARDDRARGFDLGAAPLMRFALIRLGDERFQFYWTSHHLLIDGWSTAIALRDVFSAYQASIHGRDAGAPAAGMFREYIDWIESQDPQHAADYWHRRLEGFARPTALPFAAPATTSTAGFGVIELTLSAADSARLANAARQQRLTLNTLARGVWALVLASSSGERDVVFGATIAGRPPALAGIDNTIGLFINTLPIRARLDPDAALSDWLRDLQLEYADLESYGFSSLAEIQKASGIAARTPLFESILVFENYPVDRSLDPATTGLTIDGMAVAEQTNYALTLVVAPGDELLLRVSYDTGRYDADTARAVVDAIAARLTAFADDPDQRLRACLTNTDEAHAQWPCDLPVESARTLITGLCARYSANEDLRCVINAAGDDSAAADLLFNVSDRVIDVSSPSGRFGAGFLQRIPDHLRTLVDAMARDASLTAATAPILPPAERERVLREFNRTDRAWTPTGTIISVFEAQAAAHPERVALRLPAFGRDDIAADQMWTYGELNARANQLASMLVDAHNVGPDVIVPVLAERSFEMVLALVAIEKAGGAYLPLDPSYPPDLLAFMIEDAGAQVILAQDTFRHLASTFRHAIVSLDDRDALAQRSPDNLPVRVTGDHLAYVIFTSGSTGKPKGAMNTHHAIRNRLLWMQDEYRLDEHDRVLQKTPFSFDVSVWEFFWPLMTGAQLVIARPGGHRDAAYLTGVIANTAITTLHFVPSMLHAFLDDPDVARCVTLERVICSGEALTPEIVRRYRAKLQAPLHNLYGPTEAAVDVTAWTCSAADTRGLVPIGRPIANTQLYILDERFEPVPIGITGELFLGGDNVGRGYLNRPELTAAKFPDDPFHPSGTRRFYRTGDLARYRDDGIVDFLGRIDHQVKLRGFRIELGEIESALLTHPDIRECVVVVREDQPGLKQLVAYVVARHAGTQPSGVQEHLRRQLPAHMVPELIVPLVDLPRLTNGKIDRASLPRPDLARPAGKAIVPPRSATERKLARIFEDVLGRRGVAANDDFFELGGHSLLALQLVSAVQREFKQRVPLAQLLATPTVERLAVALQARVEHDWRPLVELRRDPDASGPPLFLVPGAGGNVIYFQALAQELSPARAIYGLQAIGLDGRTPPLATVDAMASANIAEMRRVAPHGPYLLAGHSFGARVALEMAQQLCRAGETIALLGVLDTTAPIFDPLLTTRDWTDAQWLSKIAREIGEFFGVTLDVALSELQPLPLDAQLAFVVARLQAAGAWAAGTDLDELRGYLQVYKTNSQAPFIRYTSPHRVPIALFKAQERDADLEAVPSGLTELSTQHAWGWDTLGDVISVNDVPGAHLSMLSRPHVASLAAAMSKAMSATAAAKIATRT